MKKNALEKEFHMMSRDGLQKLFEVDFTKGLSSEKAASLLKKHGQNIIKISYTHLYKAFFLDFVDIFSILLWITMILAILAYTPTGNPPSVAFLITAGTMFVTLIAKASLHAYQAFNSLKSMSHIQNDKESKCRVLRDGEAKFIGCCDLTLGDLIYLERNQRVPADLRIIEAKGLYLDKSILTGETEYIEAISEKYTIDNKMAYFEATNMAFTNCLVVLGKGLGLVVDLSTNSHLGQISQNKFKPVKQRKRGVVQELSKYIVIIVAICLIGVIVYLIVFFIYLRPKYKPSVGDTFNQIISIIIGGIPYGMPISITVGLFLVSRQLKKGKILVKNVFAIDSLSSVDVIITDKTGTITRNELVVSNVLQATKEIDPELCSFDEDFDQGVYIGVDLAVRELLVLAHFNQNPNSVVNSIETALFEFAKKNLNLPELGKAYKIIDEIEFNSTNKYHVILLEPVDNDIHLKLFGYTKDYQNKKIAVLVVIGASDILLKRCSRFIEPNGTETEFNNEKRQLVEKKIDEWSFLGLRLVLLCKMYIQLDELSQNKDISTWFKTCFSLSYVGSIAFRDPPKMKVYDSIVAIRKLGLRVIMATGDYSITAASIAKEVGILSQRKYDTLHKIRNPNHVKANSIVLNGSEIDSMTKQEWLVVCRNYEEIVLSRATPTHKLICLREFQTNGFCTMMVGDGVNDVMALKSANISVAMASGSRIVSEIAQIVLIDNDFTYIYQMILTGKQTFGNIKKMFLYFTVVSAYAESITALFAYLLGIPNLYSNFCALLICVVTDVITSVSFVFEAPDQTFKKDLNKKQEHLVDWRVFVHGCLFLGSLTIVLTYINAILYIVFYSSHSMGEFLFNYLNIDVPTQNVIQSVSIYSTICMQSFGNIWAIRARNISLFKSLPFTGPRRNIPMMVSSIGVYLLVVVLINIPLLNKLIGTSPIPWPFYFIPFGYAAFIIGMNEIRLLLTRFKFLEKIVVW